MSKKSFKTVAGRDGLEDFRTNTCDLQSNFKKSTLEQIDVYDARTGTQLIIFKEKGGSKKHGVTVAQMVALQEKHADKKILTAPTGKTLKMVNGKVTEGQEAVLAEGLVAARNAGIWSF